MNYFIKNGFYIPILHVLSSKIIGLFLSSVICNQLYTVNYFYWFCNYFDFGIPKKLNSIKQFINFTYSGNLALYIYYFFPSFLPVCHNIHFIITFSYWVGRFLYKCEDTDQIHHPEVCNNYIKVWSYFTHIFPYLLCLQELKNNDVTFNYITMCYTCLWTYAWAILIYIPWRIATRDPVYTMLQTLTPKILLEYLITIHVIIGGSNCVGYLIENSYTY
jgi:hypothetical protein